jgi:hypothetical protein
MSADGKIALHDLSLLTPDDDIHALMGCIGGEESTLTNGSICSPSRLFSQVPGF